MKHQHSLLFQYICRFIRYIILFTIVAGAAYLVANIFGLSTLAVIIFGIVKELWMRIILCAFVILGCSIIFESIQ